MCLKAYIVRFYKDFRLFIGLNYCHLKDHWEEILLKTVFIDVNNLYANFLTMYINIVSFDSKIQIENFI